MNDKMNEFEDKIEAIIKSQKETNDKLTLLFNSIVGDPLTNKKGWVSKIEDNGISIKQLSDKIEEHDKKLNEIEEKKSKFPRVIESISAGGGGALVGANFDTIIQFLKKLIS